MSPNILLFMIISKFTLLRIDKSPATPVDIGNTISPKPVIDDATAVEIAATKTIGSADFFLVEVNFNFLHLFFVFIFEISNQIVRWNFETVHVIYLLVEPFINI